MEGAVEAGGSGVDPGGPGTDVTTGRCPSKTSTLDRACQSREAVIVVDPCSADRLRLSMELAEAADVDVISVSSWADLPGSDAVRPSWVVVAPHPGEAVEAMGHAHQRFGRIPVVVIGYLPPATAFAVGRLGAAGCFPKPVSGQQILTLVPARAVRPSTAMRSLASAEWDYLRFMLDHFHGNRSQAARTLGIHRSVLQRKLSRRGPVR